LERTLKGNRRIELTSLKTSSIVSPRILKGSRISQRSGKIKSIMMAIGQQMMSRIDQSTREIKSFICVPIFSASSQKPGQLYKYLITKQLPASGYQQVFIVVHEVFIPVQAHRVGIRGGKT
jgi:hypothetical protein